MMSILKTIVERRSVRDFSEERIPHEALGQILEAGRWAPSGLNNQPWSFVIIKDTALKDKLSRFTESSKVIKAAATLVVVFLDKTKSYNRKKDIQAVGASIQNMLLTAHDLGLGTCWLGEILNQADGVEKVLRVPGAFELMAVVAIGRPKAKFKKGRRMALKRLIYKEY